MITAVCAIVDLILFLATVSPVTFHGLIALTITQSSGLHLVFNLPLSKLYTNSLMSSLNSRKGWNYSTGVAHSSSEQASRFVAAPGPNTGRHNTNAIDLADLGSPSGRSRMFNGVKVMHLLLHIFDPCADPDGSPP